MDKKLSENKSSNNFKDLEKFNLTANEFKAVKDTVSMLSGIIAKIENRNRPELIEMLYKEHEKIYLELEVVSPLLTILLMEWYATKDDIKPKIPFGCKLVNITTEQNLKTVINKILDDVTGFDKFKEEFEK